MESYTKAKLEAGQLSQLVEAAFGSEISLVSSKELTGGMFNAAYDLELSNGKAVILKVAPSQEAETLSYEKNIMRTEVEALRLVHKMGMVPVPEVYSYDESLARIPYPYFFMEKIEGEPYNEVKGSLAPETIEEIETALGRYNRAINEVRGNHFGVFNQTAETGTGASWRDTFGSMMNGLLEDGQRLNVVLPASYEEVQQAIADYLPELDVVTEARLVHWDLWNGNVFVKDGRIVSIIDWERALWGDVLLEYYFRHFENSPGFNQGYGATFDSPNEARRKKLYDLYLDLILVIECYSRQYEDQSHMKWTHENLAESWIRFTSH
ncbi:aminoglycoside phosphotransferase family protein [Paenibacillus albidus]|uniref:phosphotransferase family protein n=1 Tax=Paenibacillus albidus TaxID=2041023 RepID=UPI001BE4F0CA|nr:aminoglycoside phosphotransferase family protein [Paenibacillus albidus]MBT2292101.1 aminoglycoside phosphotransferase family protein [Paenibacillus albidus]